MDHSGGLSTLHDPASATTETLCPKCSDRTCLAGAVAELDNRADILGRVETWRFKAQKCMTVFRPA